MAANVPVQHLSSRCHLQECVLGLATGLLTTRLQRLRKRENCSGVLLLTGTNGWCDGP